MRLAAIGLVVFMGGFAIMVLEIVGARYLIKDFGSSYEVWVSQIGVILGALAVGYFAGGYLGDRSQRAATLAWFFIPCGLYIFSIPWFAGHVVEAIVMRHPLDEPIPQLWQKLDPALGSALIFFAPCLILAMLSPFMIRVATRTVLEVGRMSGLIYAISTFGSIAGVFVSGFVLVDHFGLSRIFQATGLFTVGLGLVFLFWERWPPGRKRLG
jgi:MFS family permease